MVQIILKSGKDQSLRRYHPWVFSGAIKKTKGEVEEGDVVKVYDNHDEFLGIGHYQIGSIAVRILSFEDVEIDESFYFTRIKAAYDYRIFLGLIGSSDTNAYRLLHAEGDLMPGLIIDFYNGVAVIQMHSIGMYLHMDHIVNALKQCYGETLKAVYNKSGSTLPFKSVVQATDGFVYGNEEPSVVLENGIKFEINWKEGQKTGFFIDQRDNRSLIEKYAKDKSVANIFGYTGGFSLYALRGGANYVATVDSSKKAIDLTENNLMLNPGNSGKHEGFAVDAFEFLEGAKDKFDVIILDPPAFAKHHNVLQNALKGYKRLNAKGIEVLKKGGILFTFSCSQVVSKENFRKAVFIAAANSGRKVTILHQLGQPTDHPINIYHPESEYLKGLVLKID